MSLTREHVQILTAPFTANEHEFHRGFVYITESGITSRIEQVDPSWELRTNWIVQRENFSTAHVTLTICGVSRDGIGMATQEYTKTGDKPIGEPEKSAATDAMKRAARLFGIGRYLLDAPKDMNETTLRKWLNTLRSPVTDAIPRPAEPARSEVVTESPLPQTVMISGVTRRMKKDGTTDYYMLDCASNVPHSNERFTAYTYSRDLFMQAGYKPAESWPNAPLGEMFVPHYGLNAVISHNGKAWSLSEVFLTDEAAGVAS